MTRIMYDLKNKAEINRINAFPSFMQSIQILTSIPLPMESNVQNGIQILIENLNHNFMS